MKKKVVCVLLTLSMCLSLLSGIALAKEEQTTVFPGPLCQSVDLISFITTDCVNGGQVALKETNEVRWIDRLDFMGETWQMDFYNSLVEASDHDGIDDYLIDDAYYQTDSDNYFSFNFSNGTSMAFNAIIPYQLSSVTQLSSEELNAIYQCVFAVCNAFNRDHPEVFWLSGSTNLQPIITSSVRGYTYTFYYLLNTHNGFSTPITVRSEDFDSEETIVGAIQARDQAVSDILDETTATTPYELVFHFNEWLTTHNQYNTSSGGYPPSSLRSITALTGNTGTEGPVCEGYARAFKVLCDVSGIPCVLVNGNSTNSLGTGPHMWNYVQMKDRAWYAVDVTWNDPVSRTDVVGTAVSGYERNDYLLMGSDTAIYGTTFSASHQMTNLPSISGTAFTNGPVLSKNAYDPSAVVQETTPMYRLYNPNSGEHFYTGSTEERDNLAAAGWTYEGIAWNAPVDGGTAIHRLFNPNNGDHHYSASQEEIDMLVSVGWIYEGIAWNSADAEGNAPQYRLFNPNADCGSHHYTGSEEERDYLVSLGWHYEGIGWFGVLN